MNKQTNKRRRRLHVTIEEMIRSHLISEKHSPAHHFIFGVFIVLFGVAVVQTAHIITLPFVDWVTQTFGHIIQGVGAVPVVKSFETDKGGRL